MPGNGNQLISRNVGRIRINHHSYMRTKIYFNMINISCLHEYSNNKFLFVNCIIYKIYFDNENNKNQVVVIHIFTF